MLVESLLKKNEVENIQKTFVLLSCVKNMERNVAEELGDIPLVEELKQLQGMYDFLVVMKSDSIDETKQIIANKIRQINGVRSSLILFKVNS